MAIKFILVSIVSILVFIIFRDVKLSDTSPFQKEIAPTDQKSNLNTNRHVFNFEKLLTEPFSDYKNENIGFSIKYPRKTKVYEYSIEEAKQKYDETKNKNLLGAFNLSLVSQLAEGTELFDGFSIDFVYYKNANNSSLDQIVPEKTTHTYSREEDVILREDVKINNYNGFKTFKCCWGGGSTQYYFLTKKGQYILELQIFSAGPEKENFNLIIDKIIQSLEFTN